MDSDKNQFSLKEIPILIFQDQTPLGTGRKEDRPDIKRPFIMLSPPNEKSESIMIQTIETTISKQMERLKTEVIKTIRTEMNESMKRLVDEAMEDFRSKFQRQVDEKVADQANSSKLYVLLQAEWMESYNRRDNVRITGLSEKNLQSENRKEYEQENVALTKVIELARQIDATIDEKDVSSAHRLPARGTQSRPIIVKFARSTAKNNLLRKEKLLRENQQLTYVRVFEDLSRPRLNFFNLTRNDPRIENAWRREGPIFFQREGNQQIEKIDQLFEGGKLLDYTYNDVRKRFEKNVLNKSSTSPKT